MVGPDRSVPRHRPRTPRPPLRPGRLAQVAGLLLILLLALFPAVGPALAAEASATAATARLQSGSRLFEAHCVGCHVNGGNVIRRGRTLKLSALERAGLADPEAIARIAAVGIGQMSGYGAVLGEDGAAQVGEWVWQQARAGWPRTSVIAPLP